MTYFGVTFTVNFRYYISKEFVLEMKKIWFNGISQRYYQLFYDIFLVITEDNVVKCNEITMQNI